MTTDRAANALAQCLPRLFRKYSGGLCQDGGGYRRLAEGLGSDLEKLGFKIISHQTYERMQRAEENYIRSIVRADRRLEVEHRDREGEDLLQPALEG